MDIPFAITLLQRLFFTAILDARTGRLRLATCGARQTIGCHQFHFRCIAGNGLYRFNHLTRHDTYTLRLRQQGRVLHFNLEIKGIQSIALIDDDTEIGPRLRKLNQGRLNLARKDDQAANRNRVVGTSFDGCDLGMGTSTGTTLLPPQTREVTATIANHGCSIGGQPCPDQFTFLTLFYWLARRRVDALYQEGISPGVHTIPYLALTGHPRPQKFRHAILVISSDVKQLFQLEPRLPGPWLGPKQPYFKFRSCKIDPMLTRLRTNIQTHRGRHTHAGDTKINDKVEHAFILTRVRPHRNRHHIHRHRAIMKTETTGRQSIAVAIHQNIAWAEASHP